MAKSFKGILRALAALVLRNGYQIIINKGIIRSVGANLILSVHVDRIFTEDFLICADRFFDSKFVTVKQ
jgi:hypothetical protein